jgi:hypothetical protein
MPHNLAIVLSLKDFTFDFPVSTQTLQVISLSALLSLKALNCPRLNSKNSLYSQKGHKNLVQFLRSIVSIDLP